MRRGFLSLIMLLLLAAGITPGAAAGWKRQKALKFPEKVLVEINGKKKAYYHAGPGEKVIIDLTGPALVHVITRMELRGSGQREEYTFKYRKRGEKRYHKVKKSSFKSEFAHLADRAPLSESRKLRLEIPEGTHRYEFLVPARETHDLYFRFTRKARNPLGRKKLVAIQPEVFGETRQIVVREHPWTYYLLGDRDSLVTDLVGPTTLKVITRLNFTPQIMGRRSYRIKVFEDGRLKNTYLVRTRRSQVAYYLNHPDDVPGRGVPFFVTIPRGRHHYRFEFVDGGQEALLNFYLPQSDLQPGNHVQ